MTTNYSQKKSDVNLNYLGEELTIESEKVIDYGLNNNQNIKTLLEDFTRGYPDYSPADDSYFLFGNKNEMTLAGYKKLNSGSIIVNISGTEEPFNLIQGIYNSKDFSNPKDNMTIEIEGIKYNFNLNAGENFQFILSKKLGDKKYIITN